jgi:MFS-type transporter involved in bile tolerance (Atg22 family)
MFAFLALAGDLGATVSPAMVGALSEIKGFNLKTGLLFATVFPLVLVVTLIVFIKKKKMSGK